MGSLEEIGSRLDAGERLSETDVATVRKRIRKLARRDPESAAAWRQRFAPEISDLVADSTPATPPAGPAYRPKSWPVVPSSADPIPMAPSDLPNSLSLDDFRQRLARWRPLAAPLRTWFEDGRRCGARDLGIRLAQLTDCLWSCRQLARHRRHPMYPRFARNFDRVREASRQLEVRGRRGVKRALRILDEVDGALREILIALPGNMAPLTLPGPVGIQAGSAAGCGLRFIDHGLSLARWNTLSGSTWVDLGCGDGASVASLAEARPQTAFVGVDLLDRSPQLPSKGRYVRLEDGTASELQAQTLEAVPQAAAVVSLLFPIHLEQEGELAVVHQVRTALGLLDVGGQGVLISEDPIAVRAAAETLATDSRCDAVDVLDGCWSAAQLHALGITPYRPTWSELTPSPPEVAQLPAGALSWGLVVFFVRAS